MNPFRERLESLERRISGLIGETAHDAAMRNAFPVGTGRPGNISSRRSSRQAAKRIDATIDRAVKAQRLIGLRNELRTKADQFDAGLIDAHGRDTVKAVELEQARKQRKASADERIAAYLRATLKPGDVFYHSLSNNRMVVVRVNSKSVSTGGCTFSYADITPENADKSGPMSPSAFLAAVREWEGRS